MRAFAEQIRPSMPDDRRYVVLGTDGFGRSDYRKALRRHFEVDRQHVASPRWRRSRRTARSRRAR
jgi:pyruvate dehydrogenase E1 component